MTMKIGGLDISAMEFNGKSVESVWFGDNLVWNSLVPDIELDYFTLPATTEFFRITDGELDLVPYADAVGYTGSSVSPYIHGYVPDFMTLSGTTSAVNLGTYTCTITLPTGYYFQSTNTPSINITWEILPQYDIAITSSDIDNAYAWVVVNDVVYNNTTTLRLTEGTSVSVYTDTTTDNFTNTRVYYNGTSVSQGSNITRTCAQYTFTIDSNTTIQCTYTHSSLWLNYGVVRITTNT